MSTRPCGSVRVLPTCRICCCIKALALVVLGRDAEASDLLSQALTLSPNDRQILRYQAATLANLGRDGEAREVYQRYAALTGTDKWRPSLNIEPILRA